MNEPTRIATGRPKIADIVLRDYQAVGCDLIRQSFGRREIPLVVAPTGAGKGTLAAYMLAEATKKGNPSLIIAPRRELIYDLHNRLADAGVESGMIIDGEPRLRDRAIQVATIQTLYARPDDLPEASFVVWDEAHHCVARSYQQVKESYPRAKHVGLTATPRRSDKTALGNVFTHLIVIATPKGLMQRGFLVPCRILSPDNALDGNLADDPVSVYADHTPGQRAIVFAKSQDHAQALADEFGAAGFSSAAVDAKTPREVRRTLIQLFREGTIQVLCNVDVLTEGFDAPETEVVILAKKCATETPFLQRCGRGLRPAPGKSFCTLIDLPGSWHVHGRPSDERDFSLDGNPIRLKDRDETKCPACKNLVDAWMIAEGGPGCPFPKWSGEICGFVRKKASVPVVARPEIVGAAIIDYATEQLSLPFMEGAA